MKINCIEEYMNDYTPCIQAAKMRIVDKFTLVEEGIGFVLYFANINPRLQKIRINQDTLDEFFYKVRYVNVTDLEYVASLRFFLAHVLDSITGNTLAKQLKDILEDRQRGAFLVEPSQDNLKDDQIILLATAVSFMFGKANIDNMSGKYYARFTITSKDNSDTYLRKFENKLNLHTDGTFVDQATDFVLMAKIREESVERGNSLLLHLDDWEDLEFFYSHPLAKKNYKFVAAASKNVNNPVFHSIFHTDKNNLPCLSYIDQFIKPQTKDEGMYAYALGQSLENSNNILGFKNPRGSITVCNNHFWLHGRDGFIDNENLCRELMRQRGTFFSNMEE